MNTPPSSDSSKSISAWRFPLTIGLAIGIAIPLAEDVEQAVRDSVGPWPAFGIGLIAAAAAGAMIALTINLVCLCWHPKKKPTNGNGNLTA